MLKKKSDNPVFWTSSCSEAIITHWQLSLPLPIAASPGEELQMYHLTRSAFCCPLCSLRIQGGGIMKCWDLQHCGSQMTHCENVSASTLKPAGSQSSLGLSETETQWKHLGRCTIKRNKEIMLLREGLWGNARMSSYFWLENFLLKLFLYLILPRLSDFLDLQRHILAKMFPSLF